MYYILLRSTVRTIKQEVQKLLTVNVKVDVKFHEFYL